MDNRWYYIKHGFPVDLCDYIIDNATDLQDAQIGNDGYGRVDKHSRNAQTCFLDRDGMFEQVYHILYELMGVSNRNMFRTFIYNINDIQFTKYEKDGIHDWHKDQSRTDDNIIRKISASVQLSNPSDYKGGELQFKDQSNCSEFINKGDVLFFPSNQVHRVSTVTEGIRYSLVGWFTGPQFLRG